MFNKKELDWIKELVGNKVAEMKERKEYDFYTYDKEIFESILKKIEEVLHEC